ncbi:MAG: tyrosine-type recombinase/integrase [Candidatus Bathyarchaeia archaeon]
MTLSMSEYAQSRERKSDGSFAESKKVYDWLLGFESVKSWIGNYTAKGTRRNYLTGFNILCKKLNLNPDEILQLAEANGDKFPRDLKSQVKGILNEYVQAGKLGEAKKVYASLRSFLAAHEISVVFARQERIRYRRKKAVDEKVPKTEDVYGLVDAADRVKGWRDPLRKLRAKAMILCAFQSGVRPSCLTKWHYGLVKQYLYPELKYPIPLKITPRLDSKLEGYDLDFYYTFLGREAAQALKEYLEARVNRGATLQDNSPIFVTHASNSKNDQITYGDYFRIVKRLAQTVGMPSNQLWPHLLRKAFKKVLNKAEIDDDTREALMGHRIPGSRENYFDRHDVVEVTDRYAQCNFTNQSQTNDVSEFVAENQQLKDLVKQQGDAIAKLQGRFETILKTKF